MTLTRVEVSDIVSTLRICLVVILSLGICWYLVERFLLENRKSDRVVRTDVGTPLVMTDMCGFRGANACFDIGDYPQVVLSNGTRGGPIMSIELRPGYHLVAYDEINYGGNTVLEVDGPFEFDVEYDASAKKVGSLKLSFAIQLSGDYEGLWPDHEYDIITTY